jgi:hypothetical protein
MEYWVQRTKVTGANAMAKDAITAKIHFEYKETNSALWHVLQVGMVI